METVNHPKQIPPAEAKSKGENQGKDAKKEEKSDNVEEKDGETLNKIGALLESCILLKEKQPENLYKLYVDLTKKIFFISMEKHENIDFLKFLQIISRKINFFQFIYEENENKEQKIEEFYENKLLKMVSGVKGNDSKAENEKIIIKILSNFLSNLYDENKDLNRKIWVNLIDLFKQERIEMIYLLLNDSLTHFIVNHHHLPASNDIHYWRSHLIDQIVLLSLPSYPSLPSLSSSSPSSSNLSVYYQFLAFSLSISPSSHFGLFLSLFPFHFPSPFPLPFPLPFSFLFPFPFPFPLMSSTPMLSDDFCFFPSNFLFSAFSSPHLGHLSLVLLSLPSILPLPPLSLSPLHILYAKVLTERVKNRGIIGI